MWGPSWTTGKTEDWCFERRVAFHTSGSKPKTHMLGKTGNRSMFAKLYLFRLGYGPSFRVSPPDQNQGMSPRCFLGWWFLSNIKSQLKLWTHRAWGPPLWGAARPRKARALLHSFFCLGGPDPLVIQLLELPCHLCLWDRHQQDSRKYSKYYQSFLDILVHSFTPEVFFEHLLCTSLRIQPWRQVKALCSYRLNKWMSERDTS